VATTKERLDRHLTKHDREMAEIRGLVRDLARAEIDTQREIRAVATSLKALQDSLKRGTNGHTKRKLNLE
jgi:hypothetical protein